MATDPLHQLGTDLLILVLEQIPPLELVQLRLVNKEWRDYLDNNEALWRSICVTAGVDLQEWQHTAREKTAVQRDEPYIPPDCSDYDLAADKLELGMRAYDCREAFRNHVILERAWKNQHCFEMLLSTPAFRLQTVYMDHDEDTLYALAVSWLGDDWTEHLLVMNKYTGNLLLRLPVPTGAQITVGAGYVAVSELAPMEAVSPIIEPQDRAIALCSTVNKPMGQVTVYRTANAAARSVARGAKNEWKRRGLPLEYYVTLGDISHCQKMKLGSAKGEGALVATDDTTRTVYIYYLDTNRATQFSYESNPLWGQQLGADDDAPVRIRDVHIEDERVFVLFPRRLVVFTLNGNSHFECLSFDDGGSAACVYDMSSRYPYNYVETKKQHELPPDALPGLFISDTLSWGAEGTGPYINGKRNRGYFSLEHRSVFSMTDFDEEPGDSRPEPQFLSLSFSRNNLIVHGMEAAFAIVDYRKVLSEAAMAGGERSAAHVAQHTAIFSLSEMVHVIAASPVTDRIALHTPDTCIVMVDLSKLPKLPLGPEWQQSDAACMGSLKAASSVQVNEMGAHHAVQIETSDDDTDDEDDIDNDTNDSDAHSHASDDTGPRPDPLPKIPSLAFEISCLEGMAETTSVVLDSRGVYMCDWDKGKPDEDLDYSDLYDEVHEDEYWETEVRPNFGHVKVWTFRSASALLRRPEVREWQAELKEMLAAPARRLQEMEEEMEAEAERRRNWDWTDAVDGFVWLGLRDAEEHEGEGEGEEGEEQEQDDEEEQQEE